MKRVRAQIGCEDSILERYSGKNISVAILDTGIIPHPDFEDRIIGFKDFVHHKKKIYDDAGHGTHVAGCLAGSGRILNGQYKGIAPSCKLVVGKVLDRNGGGDTRMMLEALSWIVNQKDNLGIKILNISVSFEKKVDYFKIKELMDALEIVCRQGILVVVAAGNKGPKPGSLSALGMGSKVLTVGCHDGDYDGGGSPLCSEYSGRGPSIKVMKKPDMVAPGTNIVSTSYRCRKKGNGYERAYEAKSGTSFSTPLVSGAAALLWEKEPGLKSEEVKRRLCYSATDLREPWSKQGWGMLNIKELLRM